MTSNAARFANDECVRTLNSVHLHVQSRHVIREREEVHVLPTVGSQSRLVAREMRGSIERMGA